MSVFIFPLVTLRDCARSRAGLQFEILALRHQHCASSLVEFAYFRPSLVPPLLAAPCCTEWARKGNVPEESLHIDGTDRILAKDRYPNSHRISNRMKYLRITALVRVS